MAVTIRDEEIREVLEDLQKMNPEQKKKIMYVIKGAALVSESNQEEADNNDAG